MRAWISRIVIVALAVSVAAPADAGRVIRKRDHRSSDWTSKIHSAIKLGVYMPEAAGEATGFFAGLELANVSSTNVELVGTTDYFYRSRSHADGIRTELDLPYDIPVEDTADGGHSYAHLGQIGLALRVKAGNDARGPQPFAQIGANLQLLHLRATEPIDDGGRHFATRSDTFAGVGWQVGFGLVQPIDRRMAFIGEAGYNHAEPSQWDDGHSSLTAKASGAYVRLGLRFGRGR